MSFLQFPTVFPAGICIRCDLPYFQAILISGRTSKSKKGKIVAVFSYFLVLTVGIYSVDEKSLVALY